MLLLMMCSYCYAAPMDIKDVFEFKKNNKQEFEKNYLNNEVVIYGKIYKITEDDEKIAIFIKEHNSPLENTSTIDIDKRAKCIMDKGEIDKICDLEVWTEIAIKGTLVESKFITLQLEECKIYNNSKGAEN